MIDKSIVKELVDNNPQVRFHALSKLRKLTLQDASELLVSMLAEEDFEIKQSVLATLLKIGKPAIPYLIVGLQSPNSVIQNYSALILSEIGDATITPNLVSLLIDADASVRKVALEVLGNIKDISSLEYIAKLLTDHDPQVRIACVNAVTNFEDKTLLDSIIFLLADRDANVRIATAKALGKFDDPRICEALWQAYQHDENQNVRDSAFEALKRIGYRVLKCYENNFLSNDIEQQTKVRAELLVFGKSLLIPLIEQAKHPDSFCRRQTANLLGDIADPMAIPCLIKLANDTEQDVRQAAVRALGKIKSEMAVNFLISLLKNPDPTVSAIALEELKSIGRDLLRFLPDLLAKQDLNTQIAIAQLIGGISDPTVISMIAQYLEKPYPMWVRRALCLTLGETGNPYAADILIAKCLRDPETLVRTAAVTALGKLKALSAIEPLLALLDDQEEIVVTTTIEALAEIGERNVGSYLLKFLSSNSSELKLTTIRALAKLNYFAAIPLLKKITRIWPISTEPKEIKNEARIALKKLLYESQFLKP